MAGGLGRFASGQIPRSSFGALESGDDERGSGWLEIAGSQTIFFFEGNLMEKHMSVAVGKPGTIYQSSQVARVSGYHWFVRKVEMLRRAWLAQDWSKRGWSGGGQVNVDPQPQRAQIFS